MSNFSSRSFASLDHIARLSGFPGKLGEEGSKVWSQFLEGKEIEVKAYCETDVVNTYLVYLKYLKLCLQNTSLDKIWIGHGKWQKSMILNNKNVHTIFMFYWISMLFGWNYHKNRLHWINGNWRFSFMSCFLNMHFYFYVMVTNERILYFQ